MDIGLDIIGKEMARSQVLSGKRRNVSSVENELLRTYRHE